MLRLADAVGGAGADELGQAVAGRAVAVLLRAAKTFRMDRQHGDAPFGLDAAADRGHVVADDAHDAGRIDERRVGLILVDQFDQRPVELLLAAVDHVAFLQIGGEAQPVQFRSRRERAADVPRVGRAADGAVDQVYGVGDGIKDHARSAEHAGPLADRSGQARLLAGHGERLGAGLVNLRFAGFEDGEHEWSVAAVSEESGSGADSVPSGCPLPRSERSVSLTLPVQNSPPATRGPCGPTGRRGSFPAAASPPDSQPWGSTNGRRGRGSGNHAAPAGCSRPCAMYLP